MSASPAVPHTRILLGLVLGAVVGCAVNVAFVESGPPRAPASPLAAVAGGAVAGHAHAQPLFVVPGWLKAINANITEPIGQIFLRLLFITVVPLVFASLAVGVAQLGGLGAVGRVGGKTLAYFLTITTVAAVIGILLVNAVQPGEGMDPDEAAQLRTTYGDEAGKRKKADFTVLEFVKQVIPSNPISAAANLEMLGIITFALLVGIGITRLDRPKAELMTRFLEAVGELMVFIIHLAMKLAPVGVFCLIFSTTSQFGFVLLALLGKYALVVLVGLAIQGVIVLPLFVMLFTGIGPRTFFTKIRTSMATAFSTSSSNATLPTNIRVAQTEFGVKPHIASFVLPLGATMCMAGTALFEGVTVMFLAQVMLPEALSVADQIVVVILCVLTAVGAAGVPGGSIPLLMLVLASFGIEPGAIALILGIDRILDMCRTTVNNVGDMSAVVIVATSEGAIGGEVPPAPPPDPAKAADATS
jgi:DAACS family dicarboxylate/amino acid:cation (Na+ or H+) symporter